MRSAAGTLLGVLLPVLLAAASTRGHRAPACRCLCGDAEFTGN